MENNKKNFQEHDKMTRKLKWPPKRNLFIELQIKLKLSYRELFQKNRFSL